MMVVVYMLVVSIMISLIVWLISLVISKKALVGREKSSPFECGFDPKANARLPFSLRFFLIALIFLIFDVEITLILPLGVISSVVYFPSLCLVSVIFILFLVLGLYYEWGQGALEWVN